ncbi:MAG: large subunit ribosomal protein [Candidatus Atribacteria bacterium]|nr:large subunit ribosomal protein [Candidatus Atribacteria bacterium]
MSRIGKKPIMIPDGVSVEINNHKIVVKGPLGTLEREIHPRMRIKKEENVIEVTREGEDKLDRSLHGLTRTLVANMVEGVSRGFEKALEINGLGYRAQKKGQNLVLNLGFSHPVEIEPPSGVTFEVEGQVVRVKGADKEKVGQVAANIRKLKEVEPYHGTGIKYVGEVIRRKQGKAVAK